MQPVVSNVADLFTWKMSATIASNNPANGANHAASQIKILGNSFFVFMAWRGSTSYDFTGGQYNIDSGGPTWNLVAPAVIPNNFHAFVRRNNRINMMDKPCPQSVLCSTGYRSGCQVPFPVIYPPNTSFNIDVYNTAQTILTAADQTTVIPMRIDFGLFGYNVPAANLNTFLDSFCEFQGKALNQLTSQRLPHLAG